LFTLLGYEGEGTALISKNEIAFEKALEVELRNITLPGEGEKAAYLQRLFEQYKMSLGTVRNPSLSHDQRRSAYFTQLLPSFQHIKTTADDILAMNQKNMSDANEQARKTAAAARHRMIMLLMVGALVAVGFMWFTGKWILRPIARLTASAKEIEAGNLDLVVQADSRDEIGRLSEAFNAMAARLRKLRRSDRAKLIRVQQSTEGAFKVLPEAVVLLDAEGNIEVASVVARETFGFKPSENITTLPIQHVIDLYRECIRTGKIAESGNGQSFIQRFLAGEEHYFRPKAVPILDAERHTTGAIIILSDVTRERQQNELKRGVISTVAHELRTPLTSVRMALHLLLEEKIGPLTEKQAELVVAARDEGERLHSILEQLLNLSRIESGRAEIVLEPASPHQLVFESAEPFHRTAQDRGIILEVSSPDELPDVLADAARIAQVFANLISNALKYTLPGGRVSVSAQAKDDAVMFSVSDTGKGIPSQYLRKILEQFFRVPGQRGDSGVGLGLSIVQEIVTAHGGRVNVESTEGVGSTFSFTLKRADFPPKEESAHD
jgi:two-component system, NtrC family, sensor histidine kinase KinB